MASITKSDVIGAIQNLENAGQTITNKTVRDLLGRGSMSTIQQHMAAYRSEQQTDVILRTTVLNDDELRGLSNAFERVLKARIDNAVRLLNSELSEQRINAKCLAEENDRLQADLDAAYLSSAEQVKKIQSLEGEIMRLKQSHDEMKVDLKTELEKVRKEANAYQIASAVAETKFDAAQLQVAQLLDSRSK